MNNNPNQPKEDDAVLGGQAPPPVGGVILGGIEGVKNRLASSIVEARIAALSQALKYGESGLDLVIAALNDNSAQVHRRAFMLLRERIEPQAQQALRTYKTWNLLERFQINGYPDSVTTFANRKVEDFEPQTGIVDPVGTAYRVGWDYHDEYDVNIIDKLAPLQNDPQVNKLEALIFGAWVDFGCYVYENSSIVVNALVTAKEQLRSLKAVFIGDIISDEYEISWIQQSDISPILEAYPNLQMLQVRGGEGLAFSPVKHENLEALIVETGGLSRETIAQICALELPALEHLELWLGSPDYGGTSSIDDLMPILSGELFPNLIYLGLRNSEYSDAIAEALVRSPVIEQIRVLDLSMGTLGSEGAEALLSCDAINQLDVLNVAGNYVPRNITEQFSQLNCQVIVQAQRGGFRYGKDGDKYRYCSVAE